MEMWHNFAHGWGMFWWWGLAILVCIAIVWGVSGGNQGRKHPPESPEEILKKRYASGEMDREEYESKLKDLKD